MAVSSPSELFDSQLPSRLKAKPDLISQVNAKYKFVVTGDGGGTWMVDFTKPGGTIKKADETADCTVTITSADLVDIVNGKVNPQMAFMMGKLKISGDMGLALKLGSFIV